MQITGTFVVTLAPLETYHQANDGNSLARLSIDKTFQGDLAATSRGEMLSSRSPVEGAAGYVAIEHVTGTLNGNSGTFVLQHYGVMSAAGMQLTLEVVPGSGTAELVGLSGTMNIRQEDGQHYYDFSFEFG